MTCPCGKINGPCPTPFGCSAEGRPEITAQRMDYVYGGVAEQKAVTIQEEGRSMFPPFANLNDDVVDVTIRGDSAARKAVPIASGVLDYFPAALVEVARVSKAGNDKHNPGEPLHHARGKSTDHADSLLRHLIDRGKVDEETGMRHSAEMAWRALALLQQELEDEGLAPLARGAKL